MAKLLVSANADVSNPVLRVPPGTYKHLFIQVEGINTATAVALADLGQVTITKNGFPMIASVDTTNLMHIANMYGGQVGFSSTNGAACNINVPIFCYDISSPNNALFVGENDLVNIQIQWGANFTTRLSSGTVSILGDTCNAVQNYIPVITQNGYASITNVRERLIVENVVRMFVNGLSDTNFTKMQVIVDNKLLHDVTRVQLLQISNWETHLEDSTALGTGYITNATFGMLPIAIDGNIGDSLNDSLEIAITAAAAISPQVLTVGLDFTPDAQAITQAKVLNAAQTVMTRKQASGKSRAVNVIKKANMPESITAQAKIGG